jgi:hypothetical protein
MPALFDALREQSDLLVLRGQLAMEQGRNQEATGHFRTAIDLWKNDAVAASGRGLDFTGRVLAQHYLQLMDKNKELVPAEKK